MNKYGNNCTLFMIILLTVFWIVIIYGLSKVGTELVLLINLVSNPYRLYHILAFVLVLLVIVVTMIFYFDKVFELIKLLI